MVAGLFINTTNDKGEPSVMVERGFHTPDGRTFLILRRLQPYVARKPLFFGEITSSLIQKRDERGAVVEEYQRLKVYQDLADADMMFLKKQFSGEVSLPFFGMKELKMVLGNKTLKIWTTEECKQFLNNRVFKLVPASAA